MYDNECCLPKYTTSFQDYKRIMKYVVLKHIWNITKKEVIVMSKKNYNMVDLCKLLMSIIVVAIHVKPLYHVHNSYLQIFSDAIFELPVPFFFLVSGYLLAKKLKAEDGYAYYNATIVKNSLFSYIKMYLIWSVVYLPIDIIYSIREGVPLFDWFKSYFQGLFFIGEHYNSWVLWYLLSAIYALFVLFLVVKKQIGKKGLLLLAVVFVIISILCDYASVHRFPGYLKYFNVFLSNTFVNGRIFRGLFYIPLGMLIYNIKIKKVVQICLLSFGFLFNPLFDNALQTIGVILCSVGLFLLMIDVKLKDSICFLVFRKMSTGIYFIHLYVWTLLYYFLYGEKTFGAKIFLLTLLVTAALSLVYALFFVKKKMKHKENKEL